jgi:Protein of unknown function (DUF1822)
MNQISSSLTFTVPLSFEAHSLAQNCCKQQSNPHKAKQIYLNTLAVYAVDFYLRCLGFKTEDKQSDSRDRIDLKFMDVADLSIARLGKLECRPVLPDARVCQIPPEVWSDRIAYLAVEMNRTLKRATILGFVTTASAEVPIARLRSLADFPEYLNRIQQTISTSKIATNLSQWFEGSFEIGWQAWETLCGTNQRNLATVREITQFKTDVRRAKLIDLEMQLGAQSVALAIALSENPDGTVKVLVQVHPGRPQTYLPPNLRLAMLSEFDEILQEVRSRSHDNYIQLKRFEGQTGDIFRIQIALNDISITEDFIF